MDWQLPLFPLGSLIGLVLLALGVGIGWLWATLRSMQQGSQLQQAHAALVATQDAQRQQIQEKEQLYHAQQSELNALRQQLSTAHSSVSALEAAQSEQQSFAAAWQTQWKQLLETELKQTVLQQLNGSQEQLLHYNKQLEGDRQQQFSTLVEPLKTMLQQYDGQLKSLNQQTQERLAVLDTHVTQLASAKDQLVGVLASSKGIGDWGEVQLLRLLELSGLKEGENYRYQSTLPAAEGSPLRSAARPDVQVLLPANRFVVIDAKAIYLSQVLGASNEASEEEGEATLEVISQDKTALVKSLQAAVKNLSDKHYTKHRPNTPDFVMLFIPKEQLLTQALEERPQLWSEAWEKQVLLCSPLTLLPTLRLIWTIWQQEALSQNVQAIQSMGQKLHEKLTLWGDKVEDVEKKHASLSKSLEGLRSTFSGRGGVVSHISKLAELGCDSSRKLGESFQDAEHLLPAEASL